ncbi:WSC-domain-containing protein [Auriscalpium vulgare]|uniref:WSC-domain-containing protein n=1 Tax=Auriscalpium vulgare TaxID=40419 RepID=A0ACB8RY09_9AGAM|nr:WSC-domain-containing protein [Auriscalpium vulgare]
MTVEKCVSFCDSQSFVFAGLEDGCTCFCDNFFEHVLESVGNGYNNCEVPCAGNSSEFCGAENLLLVYIDYGVHPLIPTIVPSVGLWESVGCYNDSTDARALERPVNAGNVTVQSCTAACLAEGFSLAGLEFGKECWCGLSLRNNAIYVGDYDGIDMGEFREDPNGDYCNMGCEGSPADLCGGSNRLNLYNYTGAFPVGASVVPFAGAWISQGCFSDSTAQRTLERRVDAGNVTVESCADACQFNAFTMAGLEFGQECWCGNQIKNPGMVIAQSACNMACVGDSTENCGGPNALQAYYFQDSPQVIGDIQELNGLSVSLVDVLAEITPENVQTFGPDILGGMQGVINVVQITFDNASIATNAGRTPFVSNNAAMVTTKLEQYVSFGQVSH